MCTPCKGNILKSSITMKKTYNSPVCRVKDVHTHHMTCTSVTNLYNQKSDGEALGKGDRGDNLWDSNSNNGW